MYLHSPRPKSRGHARVGEFVHCKYFHLHLPRVPARRIGSKTEPCLNRPRPALVQSYFFLCLPSVRTVTLFFDGGQQKCAAEELCLANGFTILPLNIPCGPIHGPLRTPSFCLFTHFAAGRSCYHVMGKLTSTAEFRCFFPSLDLRYTGGVTTFATPEFRVAVERASSRGYYYL